jgi:hypothetical protein
MDTSAIRNTLGGRGITFQIIYGWLLAAGMNFLFSFFSMAATRRICVKNESAESKYKLNR